MPKIIVGGPRDAEFLEGLRVAAVVVAVTLTPRLAAADPDEPSANASPPASQNSAAPAAPGQPPAGGVIKPPDVDPKMAAPVPDVDPKMAKSPPSAAVQPKAPAAPPGAQPR